MVQLLMRFDLRAPDFGAPHAEQYPACLEMCEWADARGFASIVLSEHHGTEEGYLPAPLVLAAAIAGRTRRVGINVAALLAPLHDPVRLAEDFAVLDLASGGRASVVLGLGYRDEEFEMYGLDRRERVARFEECVEVLRQAWTGEPFEWRGRTVRVTPRPLSAHPPIMIGGGVVASARRAARLGLPFLPMHGDPALCEAYEEECARLGVQGFCAPGHGHAFVHVALEPERAWQTIGRHALWDASSYASWQPPGQRSMVDAPSGSLDELRASGVYRVVSPDECVELAREAGALLFHPLMGGIPPELSWESLRLFDAEVLPRLRGEGG